MPQAATPSDGDELLTPEQVRERLKIDDLQTLYTWRYRQVGPPSIKVRGFVRYPKAEFEAWLEQQASATRRGGAPVSKRGRK